MRSCALMRCYQSFPTAIPRYRAGFPRVTHPSATQSQSRHPEGIVTKCFVRLACVRHAASVHPEPGSNSHFKIIVLSGSDLCWLNQNNSAPLLFLTAWWWLNHQKFTFGFCSSEHSVLLQKKNWNFQGCITVKLSKCFWSLHHCFWSSHVLACPPQRVIS